MSRLFPTSLRAAAGSLLVIAGVGALASGAFAYTAGWLSPDRLTPRKLVAGFVAPPQAVLGHRRNHAKGICFTGEFLSNGAGAALAPAAVFKQGAYPVVGRFNLGTPNPDAADAMVRVRGIGLQVTTPNGEVWRSAMIDPPIFAVSTPPAFYDMLLAGASRDPNAMKDFAAAHPEFAAFAAWAASAPWTASYAENRFNGLDAFLFTGADGVTRPVRWSILPAAAAVPITQQALAALGPNHLEREIAERVAASPQRWSWVLTFAEPGDVTADPTKAWPEDRRTLEIGTLVVDRIEPERDGACRDLNFDPTVLPPGVTVSDDPFPAARSAAYARSYDLRTSEAKFYPYENPSEGSAKP